MSNKVILKAYERYDYNGKVVPGSLVLRSKMPKNGRWKEVPSELCTTCVYSSNCITFTVTVGDGDFLPLGIQIANDGGVDVEITVHPGDGSAPIVYNVAPGDYIPFPPYTYLVGGTYSGAVCISDPGRVIYFQLGND